MSPKAKPKNAAKKKTTRNAQTKKKVKGSARKKPARSKKKSRAKKRGPLPRGYAATPNGLLIPASIGDLSPVPPEKIRSGLSRAKVEIQKLMEALEELTEGYAVSEIELAASFNADGKFLGIGVGGATTIKVRFRPEDGGD